MLKLVDRASPPESAPDTSAVSGGEVTAALDRILSSDAFARVERPSRFLRHLVETTLRGEQTLLKETLLGIQVFGRDANWDTRLDPIVRQEAARLRKRLARYYETASPEVRIDLPVGSYVPIFYRAGAPAGTAEPSREIAHGNGFTPAPPQVETWRRKGLAVAASFLVVAAAAGTWRFFKTASNPGTTSIVVLPFTNLSADPADQYFADGLTDEITDSLARLQALRVIARSSAFQFKGKASDVREVGRLLNVANVLEGSITRSGDRIKVIAHLERSSDGSLTWSNTYERRASDLSAVQSELAAGIAGSLKVAAGVPKARHVPKNEAFDLVLKGRYDIQQMTPESVARAETEYRRAIDLDPEYSDAYFGLAKAKHDQLIARGSAYRTELERQESQQLLHKALELDPDSPDAHAMLAALLMQYDWNWGLAEREIHLAIDGHACPNGEEMYTYLLIFRGRFAEAEPHIRRTLEMNPFSVTTMNNVSMARDLEGRYSEARELAQQVAVEHPAILQPQGMIALTFIEQGRPEMALPVIEPLLPRFPQGRVWKAMALAKAGRREEALELIRPFEEKYPHPGVSLQWFALVYAFLGDGPNTVKWLERSADTREFQALSLAVDPVYAPFRNSPGFQAIEKRMGLIQ